MTPEQELRSNHARAGPICLNCDRPYPCAVGQALDLLDAERAAHVETQRQVERLEMNGRCLPVDVELRLIGLPRHVDPPPTDVERRDGFVALRLVLTPHRPLAQVDLGRGREIVVRVWPNRTDSGGPACALEARYRREIEALESAFGAERTAQGETRRQLAVVTQQATVYAAELRELRKALLAIRDLADADVPESVQAARIVNEVLEGSEAEEQQS